MPVMKELKRDNDRGGESPALKRAQCRHNVGAPKRWSVHVFCIASSKLLSRAQRSRDIHTTYMHVCLCMCMGLYAYV